MDTLKYATYNSDKDITFKNIDINQNDIDNVTGLRNEEYFDYRNFNFGFSVN